MVRRKASGGEVLSLTLAAASRWEGECPLRPPVASQLARAPTGHDFSSGEFRVVPFCRSHRCTRSARRWTIPQNMSSSLCAWNNPMTSPERQLEEELIKTLCDLKYEYRADIRDRDTLEKNFRGKFQALNDVKLTDDAFLAKCTLAQMISRYIVVVASEQKLMMMLRYQIYAVKAIVECITLLLPTSALSNTGRVLVGCPPCHLRQQFRQAKRARRPRLFSAPRSPVHDGQIGLGNGSPIGQHKRLHRLSAP